MKSKLKWFLENLFNALFNDKHGFSIRKCSGLVVLKITVILETMYTTSENLTTVLWINYIFIGFMFGMVTVQNLIELKNGKQS